MNDEKNPAIGAETGAEGAEAKGPELDLITRYEAARQQLDRCIDAILTDHGLGLGLLKVTMLESLLSAAKSSEVGLIATEAALQARRAPTTVPAPAATPLKEVKGSARA